MADGELFWKITKGIFGIMPAGEENDRSGRTLARGELHSDARERQTVVATKGTKRGFDFVPFVI